LEIDAVALEGLLSALQQPLSDQRVEAGDHDGEGEPLAGELTLKGGAHA
jgi:hypothetical protein